MLDVWQADAQGRYDLDRDDLGAGVYLLRGRLRTESDGTYAFQTVKPAPYGAMGRKRPPHIHVKIRADGYRPFTTQLCFKGDPYQDTDPIQAFRPELAMPVERVTSAVRADRLGVAAPFLTTSFDITLRPITT